MCNFNINKMKTVADAILAFSFAIMCFAIVSCEKMMGDYLEKAPGVDVDEDVIFSSQNNAESFLMGIYKDGTIGTVVEMQLSAATAMKPKKLLHGIPHKDTTQLLLLHTIPETVEGGLTVGKQLEV